MIGAGRGRLVYDERTIIVIIEAIMLIESIVVMWVLQDGVSEIGGLLLA
jgi:hypothetical protein